jgi:hypothetical protein
MVVQLISVRIGIHSRANTCHDLPITDILQQTVDKGPFSAHRGLNGMNGTIAIPEDAEPVIPLGQDIMLSGKDTVAFLKSGRRNIQMGGNGCHILLGEIGAAISLAAIPALGTIEKSIIRCHGGSPWRI